MNRILLLIAIVLCMCSSATAQDSTHTQGSLGLQAGLMSGAGISGRVQFTNGLALEATAFFISFGNVWYNIGGEVQYTLNDEHESRLYALAGAGYYRNDNDSGSNEFTSPTRVGIGVGYEWILNKRMSLGIELPFTMFIGDAIRVYPIPQLQFMYFL
ncbi:hypothetical protein BH10BAC6_BH10BAC6_07780 [soil metagenome]